MEDKFRNEIIKLEQEVIALKTCGIKTSTQMATKAVQQAVSFDLDYMGQMMPNYAWGAYTTVITIESVDGTNMLTSCTLESSDDASGYDLQGRGIYLLQTEAGATSVYKVSAWSRNPTDISTLSGGGSVTLNYTMLLTATSDFTITITQEPYSPF